MDYQCLRLIDYQQFADQYNEQILRENEEIKEMYDQVKLECSKEYEDYCMRMIMLNNPEKYLDFLHQLITYHQYILLTSLILSLFM